MKSIFTTLTLIIFLASAQAQKIDTTVWVYASVRTYSQIIYPKVKLEVDYGQLSNIFQNNRIVDENGKDIVFNCLAAGLNYMASLGWEFVNYFVEGKGQQTHYNIIMKQLVGIDEKGNYIPLTKRAFKNSKE